MEVTRDSIYKHSQLPEPVPHTSFYEKSPKFATVPAPDDTPKYLYEPPQETKQSAVDRFTRWPFLLAYALLIAIIAGVIGGIAAKTIVDNQHKNRDLPAAASSAAAAAFAEASATACPTAAPKPTQEPQNATAQAQEQEIKLPDTGCPKNSDVALQSDFSKIGYKQFCEVDWPGGDILSLYAATTSDCVEACQTLNDNWASYTTEVFNGSVFESESNNPLKCVGAGFIIPWTVNRTAAMVDTSKPSNCWLKYAIEGYPPNTRIAEGVSSVGLCLQGACPER